MNLAEASAFRKLQADIEALANRIKSLEARVDDLSVVERKRTERETLTLKKASNG